ncbi:hypothetical protein Lepto7375DRAFT_0736 [Leptolyngbya sp. PCC 7375]|nr:hypothetical protein Lepto7375DRAFT_0736 [Leptolyngbya sp. PCC 7375]
MATHRSRNIYTGGGDYYEIKNKGTYVHGDYYTSPEVRQNLVDTATEIQQLLKHLEKTYSADTSIGKMQLATEAVSHIEANLDWKERVVSALQAGGVGALASLLNHPAASFLLEAVKDWQTNKPE